MQGTPHTPSSSLVHGSCACRHRRRLERCHTPQPVGASQREGSLRTAPVVLCIVDKGQVWQLDVPPFEGLIHCFVPHRDLRQASGKVGAAAVLLLHQQRDERRTAGATAVPAGGVHLRVCIRAQVVVVVQHAWGSTPPAYALEAFCASVCCMQIAVWYCMAVNAGGPRARLACTCTYALALCAWMYAKLLTNALDGSGGSSPSASFRSGQ